MNEITRAEKLRLAGIKKYGSEKAWRRAMSNYGAKASRPGTGGFKHMKQSDPERLSRLSKEAAEARWHKEE